MASFLQRRARQKPEPQATHRFFDAWQASSAGNATHFANHWVLVVREYLDRYRLALNEALQRFDRQAGYPMAWFFHMLTTKTVPHAVAYAVDDDVQGGFSYLPERDVKVHKDWMHRPYAF